MGLRVALLSRAVAVLIVATTACANRPLSVTVLRDAGTARDMPGDDASTDNGMADHIPADSPAIVDTPSNDTYRHDRSDVFPADASTCSFPNACDTCVRAICAECSPLSGLEWTSQTLGPTFWIGFKFEVGRTSIIRQMGLYVLYDGRSNDSLFSAVVALDNASDRPDSVDLSTSDVLGTGLLTLRAGGAPAVVATGEPALKLARGWYAIVFGAGKFGATADGAMVPATKKTGGCQDGQPYFILRQQSSSDPAACIFGASSLHMFVDLEPVDDEP
jgi:hypothetical protein